MANHASRALQDKEGRKEGKIIKIANHFLYYTAMKEFNCDFVIGYLGSYFIHTWCNRVQSKVYIILNTYVSIYILY